MGQPGAGKSALAQLVARHSGLTYTVISAPDIFQKNQGESEELLRQGFEKLCLLKKPCLLILDEVDILASRVDEERPIEARLLTHLLSLLDGLFTLTATNKTGQHRSVENKVFVIALTNRCETLDPALTRSGRLDCTVTLQTKTATERREIMEVLTRRMPLGDGSARKEVIRKVSELPAG